MDMAYKDKTPIQDMSNGLSKWTLMLPSRQSAQQWTVVLCLHSTQQPSEELPRIWQQKEVALCLSNKVCRKWHEPPHWLIIWKVVGAWIPWVWDVSYPKIITIPSSGCCNQHENSKKPQQFSKQEGQNIISHKSFQRFLRHTWISQFIGNNSTKISKRSCPRDSMTLKILALDLMGISNFAHQTCPIPTSVHEPQPFHSCHKHQSPQHIFRGWIIIIVYLQPLSTNKCNILGTISKMKNTLINWVPVPHLLHLL